MSTSRYTRTLTKTALLAILGLTSACAQMEDAYDSVMGNETPPANSVAIKSPQAAPVQSVRAGDLGQPAPQQPVELGSMSDPATLAAPPAAQGMPAPIVPQPPANQQAMNQMAPAAAPTPGGVVDNTQMPSVVAQEPAVALLTVRFNQPHVYYDDALAKSVQAAERAKSGVIYEVLSTVPDLSTLPPDQQQKLSGRAKDNLRNVVVKMQQQGVNAERIRIAEQTLKVRSQEIQVYVR